MEKAFTFHTHYLAASNFGVPEDRKKIAKRGRVVGLLIVDEENVEGEVVLDKSLLKNDRLFMADVLSDFCGLIEREFNIRLDEFNDEIERETK